MTSLRRRSAAGTTTRNKEKRAEALCEIYEYVVDERGISPDSLTIGCVIDLLQEEGILFWRDERFEASQNVALAMAHKTTTRVEGESVSKEDQEACAKVPLDFDAFVDFVSPLARMFLRTFSEELVVPDWSAFTADLTYHFYKVQSNTGGNTASYIPVLRDADPEKWGLSVCSIDGQRFSIGDFSTCFSIQSTSKPVTYALCLKAEGEEEVYKWIDMEPAGRPFNTQDLDSDTQRPFNASVNSGAIMAAGLFASRFPDSTWEECVDKIRDSWRNLCGEDGNVGLSKETFESEKATAYNNFAIAYNLKGRRGLPRDVGIHKMLDVYLGCCSIEMNVEAMAVAAATLANGGVCPITGKEVFPSDVVRHVLAETMTCGMYDQAGKFAVEVGLPAKSGVSGVLMVIVPNVFGFATFSPRLNKQGNSVRGLEFCKRIVGSYGVHVFEPLRSGNAGAKINPRINGSKHERLDISEFIWAYQAGDIYATSLHDIFLTAMVQAAKASSGGISELMMNAIRSNYELVYRAALDDASLDKVIQLVEIHPNDMDTVMKTLKGDRPIPNAFQAVILSALVSVILTDGQINDQEEAFAVDTLSLMGMDRCVAEMEFDRFIKHGGHCFKETEPCNVDTETLIEVVDNSLEIDEDVDAIESEGSSDEVILLRREVHRLQRKVVNLTHLLHETRKDRTSRLSLRKSAARLSMQLKEDAGPYDKL